MALFCPNCHAQLKEADSCDQCNASFDLHARWRPLTERPPSRADSRFASRPRLANAIHAVPLFIFCGPPLGALVFAFMGPGLKYPDVFILLIGSYVVGTTPAFFAGVVHAALTIATVKASRLTCLHWLAAAVLGAAAGFVGMSVSFKLLFGAFEPRSPDERELLQAGVVSASLLAAFFAVSLPVGTGADDDYEDTGPVSS